VIHPGSDATRQGQPGTLSDFLDGLRITRFHLMVFLICGLVALLDGYDSAISGLTSTSIAKSLGLDVRDFGPVLAAAQFGYMVGGFAGGPIADHIGRKPTLIGATLMFGVLTLATSIAADMTDLVIYRFLTGLGLGAAATCFISLAAEFAPKRVRGLTVAMLLALVPTGGIVGGILASFLLEQGGWRTMYVIGGVAPLGLAILIYLFVPDSLKFLVDRVGVTESVRHILKRLSEDADAPTAFVSEVRSDTARQSVGKLFADGLAPITLAMWVSFLGVWMVMITSLAWLMPLLLQAGLPPSQAALAIAVNNIGGVAGILLAGRLFDGSDKLLINIVAIAVGAAAALGLALVPPSFGAVIGLCLVIGVSFGVAAGGLTALSATVYPTVVRATGVGWSMGMARLGAAFGPLLIGVIVARGGGLGEAFAALAFVALLAAAVLIIPRRSATLRRLD
jgi:MFS transporter, AAHS family, 4-hydroxybenzoate transporter